MDSITTALTDGHRAITALDAALRAVVGAKFAGLAATDAQITAYAREPFTPGERGAVRDLLETGSTGLTLSVDKPVIAADGTDTVTFVCASPLIAGDAALDYRVTFTGTLDGVPHEEAPYAHGTVPVEQGAVSLTLSVDFPGTYRVVIRRTAPGALACASARVTGV